MIHSGICGMELSSFLAWTLISFLQMMPCPQTYETFGQPQKNTQNMQRYTLRAHLRSLEFPVSLGLFTEFGYGNS